MKWRQQRVRIFLCVGMAVSGLLVACAMHADPAIPLRGHDQEHLGREQRWQQIGFGAQARFAECMNKACPQRTPKTLAFATATEAKPSNVVQTAQEDAQITQVDGAESPVKKELSPDNKTLVVNFPSGSARLSSSTRTQIKTALQALRSTDEIQIIGRTDNRGGLRQNRALALLRAVVVREFILQHYPIPQNNITLIAEGLCCYAATNQTAEGRHLNRRVEITYDVPEQVTP